MAVYTHLEDETIRTLVESDYAIGRFVSAAGIAQGVENTNYLVMVEQDGARVKYILTLYEKRVKTEDLPFFMELMAHLHMQGIKCPVPIMRTDGNFIGQVAGRPAAMVSFLHGASRTELSVAQVASVGMMAGKMHRAAQGFSGKRDNALSVPGWEQIFIKTGQKLDGIALGLAMEVAGEIAFVNRYWPKGLSRGVVHADMFPDNVFFEGDDVSGVIDFYFACEDFFAYDLAIVMNAWCFDGAGLSVFNTEKARALFAAYQKERVLSAEEIAAFPVLLRGAALRFLLTRAHDAIFHDANAIVVPHDPLEYVRKLAFHRNADAGVYGL